MPYYQCVICDGKGKKQEILLQANNTAELLDAHAGKSRFLLSYKETGAESLQVKRLTRRRKHFSRELIREFTGIMAALLASGNTVAASLELCRGMGGSSGKKLAEISSLILEGIYKGERFSGCLLRSTPSFPPLYAALVGIGEKTGTTAEVFRRLGAYLSTSKKIRTKVQGTLFYPIFVLASAMLGSVLVLIFVMPRMLEIFSAFSSGGADVDLSGMYGSMYILIAAILGTGVAFVTLAAFHRYSKNAALVLDRLLLKLPFMGTFFSSLESLDFCFALELCSRAGMNAALSLGEAKQVLRNRAYIHAVEKVEESVSAGGNLSSAFLSEAIFPSIIGQWIAVGEQTGEAEMVFTHLKSFFDETVDSFTERFLSALEPVLMLLTGLVVLLLVLQFVLPLFSLYGAVL